MSDTAQEAPEGDTRREAGREALRAAQRYFVRPSETAETLLRRTHRGPLRTWVLPIDGEVSGRGLAPGMVVEICGDEGTGKTQALMTAVCACVMPETWGCVATYGAGEGAVVVDADLRFAVAVLARMLAVRFELAVQAALETHQGGAVPAELEETVARVDDAREAFVVDCLSRVWVLSPDSASAYLLAMHTAWRMASQSVEGTRIALVCIDSLAAFFWAKKSASGDCLESLHDSIPRWVNRIRAHVALIVTKPLLFALPPGAGHDTISDRLEAAEYMSKAWAKLVSHRLLLQYQDAATGRRLAKLCTPHISQPYLYAIFDHGLVAHPASTPTNDDTAPQTIDATFISQ